MTPPGYQKRLRALQESCGANWTAYWTRSS